MFRILQDASIAVRRAALIAALCAIAPPFDTTPARSQDMQEVLTSEEEISPDYDTWSLFLICSASWARPETPDRLGSLWQAFSFFGQTIGHNHLAVWFWKEPPDWGSETISENLDIERAATFCDTYDLAPSRGPHVLVLDEYPDADSKAEAFYVIEFAGTPLDEIEGVLNDLADKLLSEDFGALVSAGTEDFWFGLFSAIREPIRRLSQSVTVKVTTPVLAVELTGGGGQ